MRLPTKDELLALYVDRGTGALSAAGWTLQRTWSSTLNSGAGAHYYVLLHQGNEGYYTDDWVSYVTCVH